MMRMSIEMRMGCSESMMVSFELLCYDIGVELFGGAIAARVMPKSCDCRKFKTRGHGHVPYTIYTLRPIALSRFAAACRSAFVSSSPSTDSIPCDDKTTRRWRIDLATFR